MFTPARSPTPDMILMQDLLNLRSFITSYSWREAAGRRVGEEQRGESIESRAQTEHRPGEKQRSFNKSQHFPNQCKHPIRGLINEMS